MQKNMMRCIKSDLYIYKTISIPIKIIEDVFSQRCSRHALRPVVVTSLGTRPGPSAYYGRSVGPMASATDAKPNGLIF